MEPFARTVIGYHGCRKAFARDLLAGKIPISSWKPSQKTWEWLGQGIYFFEHSPKRALSWAHEHFGNQSDVIGGIVQLGRCFDLLDESNTALLGDAYQQLNRAYNEEAKPLPDNRRGKGKRRDLDCLVINDCLKQQGIEYDTVRGAFLEGDPVYPGASFSAPNPHSDRGAEFRLHPRRFSTKL